MRTARLQSTPEVPERPDPGQLAGQLLQLRVQVKYLLSLMALQ